MRFKQRTRIERGRLDMTPLIDVVFLLLIFFMLTFTFITPPGIKVKLPKAVTAQALEKDQIVITLTRKKELFLESEPITRQALEEVLKGAAQKNKTVLIEADREVVFDEVISIWDKCRSTGVSEINIATTP
ncbi:MAG: biopolymer transporter ExbD [Candidatus Omnitrophica bacterium]|nr:biopolymer transporter ExbD [Candidatus Omnitrophota bacterium]